MTDPLFLNRGDPLSPDLPAMDLILAADCVYLEEVFPLLVQTLSDLSGPQTEILFCCVKRRKVRRSAAYAYLTTKKI